MNVYDFDETIYDGDCTRDFFKSSLKYPMAVLSMIVHGYAIVLYGLKLMDKTTMKSIFFRYMKHIPDKERMIESLTDRNFHKIKSWYLDHQKKDDVIISASPLFLVEPFCKRLGIRYVYATNMDINTGAIDGVNCKGEAKVDVFYAHFPNGHIHEFYSDSFSDTPLARLADQAYLVKKDQITPWPKEKL